MPVNALRSRQKLLKATKAYKEGKITSAGLTKAQKLYDREALDRAIAASKKLVADAKKAKIAGAKKPKAKAKPKPKPKAKPKKR